MVISAIEDGDLNREMRNFTGGRKATKACPDDHNSRFRAAGHKSCGAPRSGDDSTLTIEIHLGPSSTRTFFGGSRPSCTNHFAGLADGLRIHFYFIHCFHKD